jgi:4,5-dihydroxyphthalate decarboxylase
LAFTAIPAFPRRLFSQSNMYRNLGAGIESPIDLVGRRVGLSSYQTTLCVLAKGDLHHEYGVPWTHVRWVVGRDQALEAELPADLQLEVAPPGANLSDMLARGDIAALLVSRTPRCFLDRDPRVGRLFAQPREEEVAYFRRNGFFPIMHVVTFKDEVLQSHPWLGPAFVDAFNRALTESARHWEDPNWSRLAWGQQSLEEETRLLGRDPWTNGVEANRANLERFIAYSHEQGLISRRLLVEELFAPTTLDT